MEIEVHIEDARAILVLRGQAIDDLDRQRFREAVDRVLRDGYRVVVLDLQGVTSIDSAFLGEIIRARTMIDRQKGVLSVANPTQRIRDLLTVIESMLPKLFHPSASRASDARSNGPLWVALSILLVIIVMIVWRLAGLFRVP